MISYYHEMSIELRWSFRECTQIVLKNILFLFRLLATQTAEFNLRSTTSRNNEARVILKHSFECSLIAKKTRANEENSAEQHCCVAYE